VVPGVDGYSVPMSVGHELVDHDAGIGVRLWAPTAEEVFEQAALGTFSLVCDPLEAGELKTVAIALEAEKMDLLLAAWVNELLAVFDIRRIVLSRFDIDELTRTSLRAHVSGEPLDPDRHVPCGGVKAATLRELSLERRDDGWAGFVLLAV
jgi:SHS2 domain-containing protein